MSYLPALAPDGWYYGEDVVHAPCPAFYGRYSWRTRRKPIGIGWHATASPRSASQWAASLTQRHAAKRAGRPYRKAWSHGCIGRGLDMYQLIPFSRSAGHMLTNKKGGVHPRFIQGKVTPNKGLIGIEFANLSACVMWREQLWTNHWHKDRAKWRPVTDTSANFRRAASGLWYEELTASQWARVLDICVEVRWLYRVTDVKLLTIQHRDYSPHRREDVNPWFTDELREKLADRGIR